MVKIEVGDMVQCNVPNTTKSLPKKKRTVFGYVMAMSSKPNEPPVSVRILDPVAVEIRRISHFDHGDVKPLKVPMTRQAQQAVLMIAQICWRDHNAVSIGIREA